MTHSMLKFISPHILLVKYYYKAVHLNCQHSYRRSGPNIDETTSLLQAGRVAIYSEYLLSEHVPRSTGLFL